MVTKIFGGFQVAGSLTYAAGRPFTAFDSANNSSIDLGEEQALPNVIGTPVMPETVTCWFYTSTNPGCKGITGTNTFSLPAPGVFGNSGRNTLRGPGMTDLDVSVSRNFAITERIKNFSSGQKLSISQI